MNCSVSNEYSMYNFSSAITVPLVTSNNDPMLLFKSCKFISIYYFFDTSCLILIAQNFIVLCKVWEILSCAIRYKIKSSLKVQAKSQPDLFRMILVFSQHAHFSTFLCTKIEGALTNILHKMK